MIKTIFYFYISLFLVFFLASDAIGITLSYSDKVSGTGSFNKDYKILNDRNDFSKVSVDLKNAVNYEYGYSTYSDEIFSSASEYLIVDNADSIICSGEARNRNSISTKISTSIYKGNLTYNNSVKASGQGVQASQNITGSAGDGIIIEGEAVDNDGTKLSNSIISEKCEGLKSTQRVMLGKETIIGINISAITGPLKATSIASTGKRTLKTTAYVVAGVVDINQSLNSTHAYQDSIGVAGPVAFNVSNEDIKGNINQVYSTAGSGNLISLSQHASENDAYYELEYEYMPISYQTGTYDEGYASSGSYLSSDKEITNKLVAPNCEHLQVFHESDIGRDPLTITRLNAIAGPIKLETYTLAANRKATAIAEIAAGVASIDQRENLTEAYQRSKGVSGGVKFFSSIEDIDHSEYHVFAASGSGNLTNLTQYVSGKKSYNEMDYEYLPTSYQTGTYDANYFQASSANIGDAMIDTQLDIDQCDAAKFVISIDSVDDLKIHQELYAKSPSSRINWSSIVGDELSNTGREYYETINGAIGSTIYNRVINVAKNRNFTDCDPFTVSNNWVSQSLLPPDPLSKSTWDRKWSMNESGSYSSINELLLLKGTFQLDETLGIKRIDCRWSNLLKET